MDTTQHFISRHANAKLMGPNGGEQFWGKVRSTPKLWTAVWFPWSAWLAISTLMFESSIQLRTQTLQLKLNTRYLKVFRSHFSHRTLVYGSQFYTKVLCRCRNSRRMAPSTWLRRQCLLKTRRFPNNDDLLHKS